MDKAELIAEAKACESESEKAVTALIEALNDEDNDFRGSAAYALRYIHTPKALKALREYERRKGGD